MYNILFKLIIAQKKTSENDVENIKGKKGSISKIKEIKGTIIF